MFAVDEAALRALLQGELGMLDARLEEIRNGDECRVFRFDAPGGATIARVHPPWHDAESVRWTHALARHCSASVPEAVAPLALASGDTVGRLGEQLVSLMPWVPGGNLDRDRSALRIQAARVLAALHRSTASWSGGPRPHPPAGATGPVTGAAGESVQDPDLDAFERSLPGLALTRLPIHGDFYPRNVLATDARVTGVIDWDEARVDWLMAELSWAAWELCSAPEDDGLCFRCAEQFLGAYLAASPPCAPAELTHLLPFIRLRLRREIRYQLAVIQRGGPWDDDHQAYLDHELRAFSRLRDAENPLRFE